MDVTRRRQLTRHGLSGVLAVTGTLHLLRPEPYFSAVPRGIGSARGWVYFTGVAELAGGFGLAVPATRRAAGLCTAAMFAGFVPAHVALIRRSFEPGGTPIRRAVMVARLPLQLPLIRWALRAARLSRATPSLSPVARRRR